MKVIKVSLDNYTWLLKQGTNPNRALNKLRIGEELTDPKYWELVKKINDLQGQVDDIQNIVDDRSGGY